MENLTMTSVNLHQKINLREMLIRVYTQQFGNSTKGGLKANEIFKPSFNNK